MWCQWPRSEFFTLLRRRLPRFACYDYAVVGFLIQPCAEIDSCDFLFLKQISELDHNGLRLILEEAAANPETTSISVGNTQITDCHRVESTISSRIFEIVWDHYVGLFSSK